MVPRQRWCPLENNFDAARSTYSYNQSRHRRPLPRTSLPHLLVFLANPLFPPRIPSRRRSCSGTLAGNAEKERTHEKHQRGGYRDERGTEERERCQSKSETKNIVSRASGEKARGREIGRENGGAGGDREGERGKEREGVIFAREGCAVHRAAAQNLGRAHFPPSFWPS